jgi:Ulp1 family protease
MGHYLEEGITSMLNDRQDIELTNADIQQLSNRDALTAFEEPLVK